MSDSEALRVDRYVRKDVSSFVPVHLEAFRGYPNGLLGPGYAAAALGFFCDHPEAIALGCWSGKRAVGYVSGVRVEAECELVRAVRWSGIRALAARPWLMLDRRVGRKIVRRILELMLHGRVQPVEPPAEWPKPVMGLVSIGVANSVRGRGAGRLLVKSFEAVSRERGYRTAVLSVYAENLAARGLYESLGWQVLPDHPGSGEALFYWKSLEAL